MSNDNSFWIEGPRPERSQAFRYPWDKIHVLWRRYRKNSSSLGIFSWPRVWVSKYLCGTPSSVISHHVLETPPWFSSLVQIYSRNRFTPLCGCRFIPETASHLCAVWDSDRCGLLTQWFFSTRLETRTKESSTCASSREAKGAWPNTRWATDPVKMGDMSLHL